MTSIVRFDCFDVDLDACQLLKRGTHIKLRGQSFQVLASLLERPGEVVTREELQRQLWGDNVFVDFENNLNTAVARLRLVLGDSPEHPRFIETLPRVGYRFVGKVIRETQGGNNHFRNVRLLVLPFANLSGDGSKEFISDAITDEMITALAQLAPEQVAVIARTTAMHYKGSHLDVTHIARELKIDYVVEGAVHCQNGRVGLNVQLIRASDQTHVHAEKHEILLTDIFNLQDWVVTAIGMKIPCLSKNEVLPQRPRAKRLHDLEAYSEYLQGRLFPGRGTATDWTAAKQHLENAIARDPEFAEAYDAMAELHWYMGYLGVTSSRVAFEAGIVYVKRALELDNSRAETHALLAQFHKTVEYNWPEVHREMSIALHLDPNSPLVKMRYAVSELMPHGHLQEAVRQLRGALEVDPLSFFARMWLGVMLLLSRQQAEAVEESRRLLELDPQYAPANFVQGIALGYLGDLKGAVEHLWRAAEFSNQMPAMLSWLGLFCAIAGRKKEARKVLDGLYERALKGYVSPACFAWIHLGLGEIDTAFEWMNKAVDECDQLMMPIKNYGFLDPFRKDPRYEALLRKMNLL